MDSRKYNRTYHYDFSPGTTSDDRINRSWYEDMQVIDNIVHTEKMDGENNALNEFGIFARSHAIQTRNPWSDFLKQKYSLIKNDLKDNNIEIFGENLYAIHSIIYPRLEEHFYIFAVRCLDKWLSWEEVLWYSEFFDFKTVPILSTMKLENVSKDTIKDFVLNIVKNESTFGSIDTITEKNCSMEGIVSRNINEYDVDKFKNNVFKYVRKNHVKTDEHWSRNWKRSKLISETKKSK